MNILLINSNRYKKFIPVMPIGASWICSMLEKNGHNAFLLDLMFSTAPVKDIQNSVKSFKPDVVGVSIRNIDNGHFEFFPGMIKDIVITPLKECFTGPIVIGGSAVGLNGPELLHYLDLMYAIAGDGEAAMLEFVDRLEANNPLMGIKGLIIREKGTIIEHNPPAFTDNLKELPHPDIPKYINVKSYENHSSHVQIQTKRGCTLGCTYCACCHIEGSRFRFREIDDIVREIEILYKESGITTFEIVDNAFNVPLDYTKAFLRAVIKKRLPVCFKTSDINPGAFDEELAELLVKANFIELGIAVESGSNLILENMGKKYNAHKILEVHSILRKKMAFSPVSIFWSYLLGAPGESEETLRETYDIIKSHYVDDETVFIAIGIRIYNKAPMANDFIKLHSFRPDDNFFKARVLEPKAINLDQIRNIVQKWSSEYPNIVEVDDFL